MCLAVLTGDCDQLLDDRAERLRLRLSRRDPLIQDERNGLLAEQRGGDDGPGAQHLGGLPAAAGQDPEAGVDGGDRGGHDLGGEGGAVLELHRAEGENVTDVGVEQRDAQPGSDGAGGCDDVLPLAVDPCAGGSDACAGARGDGDRSRGVREEPNVEAEVLDGRPDLPLGLCADRVDLPGDDLHRREVDVACGRRNSLDAVVGGAHRRGEGGADSDVGVSAGLDEACSQARGAVGELGERDLLDEQVGCGHGATSSAIWVPPPSPLVMKVVPVLR